jgi:hypothetical protein
MQWCNVHNVAGVLSVLVILQGASGREITYPVSLVQPYESALAETVSRLAKCLVYTEAELDTSREVVILLSSALAR